MAKPLSPLAPFVHTTFRTIWLANLASSFGALIQGVGAAWLMTTIADSVDMVALVQASTALPVMLFSLLGGAIADSFNRRRVMLIAQGFMFAVSAALMISTLTGFMSPWLLLSFTFLLGCGMAFNNPSWQASVGDLVPRDHLPSAVALNSIGFNLSRSVGPAVGGVIVAAAGAGAAFAVNTLSYVALIVVLFRWQPGSAPSVVPRETIGQAMIAGLRYVAMSPNIGKMLIRSTLFGFSAIVILALLPAVAAALPDGGPSTYGLMLGAFGLGAIGGALLGNRLNQRFSSEAIVRMAFIGFAACAMIAATSPSPWLTGAGLAIGGASWVLALSLFNVSVQMASPRWVVGRALSIYQMATFGGMALGSWIWGVVADTHGLHVALMGAGGVLLAGAALGLGFPMPQRSVADLDPLNRWKVPTVAVDLQPRSGPILVQIAYRIKEAKLVEFMGVMTERQRIRRRDGARHWTLNRDLAEPETWIESYRLPTWTDYVRHNLRVTKADAGLTDRVRTLHEGPSPPVVHRYLERPTDWLADRAGPPGTIDPP
jgi:MFS family permease